MLDSTDIERIDAGSMSPYALDSLEERMITRILEREEEGYTRWEPRPIYEQIAAKHPELYPPDPPRGLLSRFLEPQFSELLAARRMHRYTSRLPHAMLADAIGRRTLDLIMPTFFKALEAAQNDEGIVSVSEARRVIKDALAFIKDNETYLRPPAQPGTEPGTSDQNLSMEDAMRLISVAAPDRKQAIAQYIAMQLVQASEALIAEEAEVVDGDTL